VQILVSDGLSAEAVHHNVPELLPVLLDGLRGLGTPCGRPLAARYGRVKLAEAVAEQLHADLVVHLIGERPGGDAHSSRSLSAYLVYRLSDPAVQAAAAAFGGNASIRFEISVLSNIYSGGLPPLEAAGVLVERVGEILSHQAAGHRLESLLRE
jgi:ethanolamine ammonia-lyase large subunit